MDKYLIVMLGGAVGSLARYVAGTAIMTRFGGRFPLGTLIVNSTGCFLIGAIMTLLTRGAAPHPNWRLLLVVGFLGGYTTFSSFAYETFLSNKARFALTALGMVIGTASLILVVTIGMTGKQYVLNQIQAIGTNQIEAEYQSGSQRIANVTPDPLTIDDMKAAVREVPG